MADGTSIGVCECRGGRGARISSEALAAAEEMLVESGVRGEKGTYLLAGSVKRMLGKDPPKLQQMFSWMPLQQRRVPVQPEPVARQTIDSRG